MDLFLNIMCAIISNIAFSIFFNVPKRAVIYCTLTGTIGWVTYYLLHLYLLGNAASNFLASVIIGICAEYFSHKIKMPSTVFIYIGIIMLVPGYRMYMCMEYFAKEEYLMALNTGSIAVIYAVSIAVGVLVSSIFSKSIKRVKFSRFNKIQENNDFLK